MAWTISVYPIVYMNINSWCCAHHVVYIAYFSVCVHIYIYICNVFVFIHLVFQYDFYPQCLQLWGHLWKIHQNSARLKGMFLYYFIFFTNELVVFWWCSSNYCCSEGPMDTIQICMWNICLFVYNNEAFKRPWSLLTMRVIILCFLASRVIWHWKNVSSNRRFLKVPFRWQRLSSLHFHRYWSPAYFLELQFSWALF